MAVIVMRSVDAPVPHTVSEFCWAHASPCHSATESVSELVESYMRQLFLIDAVVLDDGAFEPMLPMQGNAWHLILV